MEIYLMLALCYVVGIIIEIKDRKLNNRKLWISILIIPLFLLTAFRGLDVGNDTYNYYLSFNSLSNENLFSPINSRLEIGYVLLIRLFGMLDINYFIFQVCISIFVYISIAVFIYKYSSNKSLSIFIFITMRMMFGSMNITRQYIAIAIILYSFKYLINRNLIKFSIIVLIASLFHETAIIFLIIYPISYIKLTNRRIILILTMFLIINITFARYISLLTNFLGVYDNYLNSKYFDLEGNVAVYFQLGINIAFFILALTAKKYRDEILKKEKNRDKKSLMLFYTSLLAVGLGIVGLKSAIIDRLVLYFSIFSIVYIPNTLSYIRNKKITLMIGYIIIIFLFISFFIIMKFRPNWNNVIPYSTWIKEI